MHINFWSVLSHVNIHICVTGGLFRPPVTFEPIIDNTMPLNQNYKHNNKIREVSPIPVETSRTPIREKSPGYS